MPVPVDSHLTQGLKPLCHIGQHRYGPQAWIQPAEANPTSRIGQNSGPTSRVDPHAIGGSIGKGQSESLSGDAKALAGADPVVLEVLL
jgi:hypothetical protein